MKYAFSREPLALQLQAHLRTERERVEAEAQVQEALACGDEGKRRQAMKRRWAWVDHKSALQAAVDRLESEASAVPAWDLPAPEAECWKAESGEEGVPEEKKKRRLIGVSHPGENCY